MFSIARSTQLAVVELQALWPFVGPMSCIEAVKVAMFCIA